ncbi:diguanylate cyclase domain-containing protein [Pleomorphomonas sp. JP5]|uniref:diguanylate cyclase domain-containing protein n=1 Tax=Pleomorphomonas sp. JP5 TaxID=2942998 RepID=UPI002044B40B|nr:diguanylate cyclase [Pleomorphomonas sp. JP5]MCM5557162.1 diguanylate cyclase [Pleomorphomonas sp. JP5]
MFGLLKIRIVILAAVFVGLVPFVASEIVRTRADMAQQLGEINQSILTSLRRNQKAFIEVRLEVERLSETIALSRNLRSISPEECNESVAHLLAIQQKVERISLLRPDGVAFCSTDPRAIGVYFGDRGYFSAALASTQVVWSDFILSRITGKRILQSAKAIRSGDRVDFVLTIALNSTYLRQLSIEQFTLPLTYGMLLDIDGNVLDGGAMPGVEDRLSEETTKRMAEIGTGLILPGTYGAGDEVFGVARLPGSANLIGYGVTTEAVRSAATHAMIERLALVGLVALGLVAVVLGLLEWLVLRGLRQVVHVAERVAAGDWTSRITQTPLLPDLALVGRSVNMMLDSLEASVNTDALTGLANRRALDRFLLASLNRLKRHNIGFTVVMIDIDAFKAFNDQYGHGTGDDVLQVVGATIQRFARRTDEIAARYGGEEFTLILTETDPEKLRQHLEALRRAVEAVAIPHYHSPHAVCTVSIGYAAAEPDDSPLAAISRADGCMYLAKNKGRNRVEGLPEGRQDRELFSRFMTEVA